MTDTGFFQNQENQESQESNKSSTDTLFYWVFEPFQMLLLFLVPLVCLFVINKVFLAPTLDFAQNYDALFRIRICLESVVSWCAENVREAAYSANDFVRKAYLILTPFYFIGVLFTKDKLKVLWKVTYSVALILASIKGIEFILS